MKKSILLLFLSFILFSCEDKDNDGESPRLLDPQIEMSVSPSESNAVSFSLKAQSVAVDWGDGTIEDFSPKNGELELSHKYDKADNQQIKIEAKELTSFIYNDASEGKLQSINFVKASDLQLIDVSKQELKSLDVTKLAKMKELSINENTFADGELAKLIASLPTANEEASIVMDDDQYDLVGIDLEGKGWEVYVEPKKDEVDVDKWTPKESDVKMILSSSYQDYARCLSYYYITESAFTHNLSLDELQPWRYAFDDIYNHKLSPYTNLLSTIFQQSYKSIRNTNFLIDILKNKSDLGFETDQYIYASRLLRAMNYFNLINIWGDIPYVDENNYNNVTSANVVMTRMPVDQVVTRLIADIEVIANLLPENDQKGYVLSKSFAYNLLAKLYLQQKDYTKALMYAQKVIELGKHQLAKDASMPFNDNNNPELLTSLNTTWLNLLNQQQNTFFQLIEKGENLPLGRYAETLLIAAEAELKRGNLSEVPTYLNSLRERNKRELLSAKASAEQIEKSVLEEYKNDMKHEGLYFFALKRLGKATTELKIEAYQQLFPISQREVDLGLKQNPGYKK